MAEVQYLVTIEIGGNADAESDQQDALETDLVKRINELNAQMGGSTARVTACVKQ